MLLSRNLDAHRLGIAMPEDTPPPANDSRRVLGLWDAVSLILGIVIGTSIFRSPSLIYSHMPGVGSTLALWVAGGLLSILGALCFAELAAAWPERGGDVSYLSRAFGPLLGYLLGWCRILVIIPANVGIMSFAFQDYVIEAGSFNSALSPWIAMAAVAAMTLINLTGVQAGRRAQNLLTGSKLAGFALVVLAGGLIALRQGWPALSSPLPDGQSVQPGFALIFILFAFGGWNDSVYIAAEMREPQKNLPRALAGGVAAVLLVYLLVNISYAVLGIDALRKESVPARAVAAQGFGNSGGLLVSGLMMISALGAMHGTIFGGTRLAVAMGERYRTLGWLSHWSKSGAPTRGVWLVGIATGLLVCSVETHTGRQAIDTVAKILGSNQGIPWDFYGGGFATLLASTTPLFWIFFLLAGAAQIVLRFREPSTPRPFRTPFYPVTPMIFMGTSAYLLYSSVTYAGWLSLIGLIPMGLGLVAWLWERKSLQPETET